MQGNDLSNQIAPRLMIVWENLLGVSSSKAQALKISGYIAAGRWSRAVDAYDLNEAVAQRMWDLQWRMNYEMDVITFVSEKFARALEGRIEEEDLPVNRVVYFNPGSLARQLAYMPHVAAVYTADPSQVFTFGSKGRVVQANNPDLIGVL